MDLVAKRPLEQTLALTLSWVLGGLLAVGRLLDAVSNATNLLTPSRAILASVIVLLPWISVELLLRFRGTPWRIGTSMVRVQSLGLKTRCFLAGAIVLFWIPSLLGYAYPANSTRILATAQAQLSIEAARQVTRGPVWGWDTLDSDEVVAAVALRATTTLNEGRVVVAFWRLANEYETNWHIARRRVGQNYLLARLEGAPLSSATASTLLAGGIECEKTYAGDIAIVVLAVPTQIVEEKQEEWLNDEGGWGFEALPTGGAILASQVITFPTTPIR